MPSITASKRSPGFIATIGPSAPVSTMSPARSGSPRLAILRASQTAALSGWPKHSLPRPLETCSLLRVMVIAQFLRSSAAGRCAGPPTTYTPQEALSATVSTNLIDQSRTRLPTTSRAGTTHSMALYNSSNVVSACGRSRFNTSAISASILGCRTRPKGMVSLSP